MASASTSFRVRLIAGALAPLVIAGMVQALYSVVSQRHAAIDGLEAKARAVTTLLVDVAGPSIATDDPQAVDEGLGYFANDSDFEFALAIAPDGKAIGYRGATSDRAAHVAAARITKQPDVARADGRLIASYPVITGTKTIGEVVVGFRTENVKAKAAALTTWAALISLCGIAAAVLVVLALAGRIARRNREMTALLDNMEQAFLSIGPDGTLAVERSAVATALLGPFKPNQKLWEALAPVDPTAATWLELGWAGVLEGFMPPELSFDQLPKKLDVGDRVYRVEYKPSITNEVVGNTLVVITDATAELARTRAEAAERDLLRMIEKLTNDRAGFVDFMAETSRLVQQIGTGVGQAASDVFKRELHTLKGNCGSYGLSALAERCHELEDRLVDNPVVDIASVTGLAKSWTDLKQKLESVFGADLMNPAIDVRPDDLAELHEAIASGASLVTIRQLVKTWALERTKPRLERFAEQARSLAQRLGKADLVVNVADHNIRLDPDKTRMFWSAFTHVVRNAVDHGIEPAADRLASGKTDCGHLDLETRREGDAIVVEVRDDGRGIDWDRVRTKAGEAGLPHTTHQDLVDAILSDGMTTRDQVTETSGRGVGLAALRAACVPFDASIEVDSERGKGSRFRFTFRRWAQVTVPIPLAMGRPRTASHIPT